MVCDHADHPVGGALRTCEVQRVHTQPVQQTGDPYLLTVRLIEDEESMGPYYLSVLVPNKPVADEGDLEVYIEKHECIAVEGQGRFCASNKSDWCRLVDLIKEIHRKIVMK